MSYDDEPEDDLFVDYLSDECGSGKHVGCDEAKCGCNCHADEDF